MRRPSTTEPPPAAAMTGSESTARPADGPGKATYLAARAEWNERYGSYVQQARAWRLAFFMSAVVSLMAVGGVVYIGSQSHLVPYIVEVNRLGDALAAQRADVASTPDTRLIRAQLARWINDTRTVYLDASAERYIINEAYGMVDRQSAAYGDLNTYFRTNDPFNRAQTQTVNVHITSVLPISQNTWRIEWNEETDSRDGSTQQTAHWQATVTIALHPPSDSETVLINPTGLYVQNFSWTQAQ
ncbi:conjugal transfer protein TrbF [Acidisoma cladoniae]|jgi:type IV secretory pathway TrbF-like protein|uniref:conjugal transfer protein TrbF n=1 Tax=Acidisoma cladoniae TaxID=3040935 RepID=UPI0025508BDA|nr:conjugal transfer protein TrbF [Acidisoma sp. PAMC 29798]